jgi:MYXO-CTERM domain-containing protein
MRSPFRLGSAALLSAVLAAPLSAQTVSFTNGTTYSAPALTGFETLGNMMGGMTVSWQLVGGGSGSASWGDLGGGNWGVSGGGVQVFMAANADTYFGLWSVWNDSNAALKSLLFNGAPGRTLFDTDNGGFGTEGSFLGLAFQSPTTQAGVSAQYSNIFKLTGDPAPVGDLYEQLFVDFGDGLSAGSRYSFYADTDNSPTNAPPPTPVSEPISATLLAAGLVGLVAARRRKV